MGKIRAKALLFVAYAGMLFGQSRPAFGVASIKPSADCEGDRQDEQFSPGRVSVTCITLPNLIQAAYGTFADGRSRNPLRLRLVQVPEWGRAERYDIVAKAEGDPPMEQMFGPMLETLLEDRFRLKVHRETREMPVYVMTVAKGGLKIKQTKPGSCVPVDLNHANDPAPNFCGRMTARGSGGKVVDDAYGMTMTEIATRFLANRLDRPVIDQTGGAGIFDAHLEFVRDITAAEPAEGPSIFTAVEEQLGLKLSAGTGPVEVLVIDHVERPSAD